MSPLLKAAILGLVTGVLGLCLFPLAHSLEEDFGLGLLFQLRGTRTAPADVAIVTLDRDSAEALDLPPEPDKWPRSLHAQLTDTLAGVGAAVIGFDIIFDEAQSPEQDRLLVDALQRAGSVVLCQYLEQDTAPLADRRGSPRGALNIERLVPPIRPLADAAAALAPFPLPKVPVKLSQYWTFKTGAGDTPTLPVVTFQIYALDAYPEFIGWLQKAGIKEADTLPPDRDAVVAAGSIERLCRRLRVMVASHPTLADRLPAALRDPARPTADPQSENALLNLIRLYLGPDSHHLNFYGPPGTIPTLPFSRLVHHPEDPTVLSLKGKAVFVGLSEQMRPQEKDGFHTVYSEPSGIDLSGVEIAATAFANLVENMPVRPLAFPRNLVTVFLWGTIIGVVCFLVPRIIAGLAVLAAGVLYLTAALHQFGNAGTWYPLVVPCLIQAPFAFFGSTMWKYADTHRERQNIRKAIGYHLPDKVVDQLARNVGAIQTDGKIVYGTCLFTDAERYTTLSETLGPQALHDLMGRYFEALFAPVTRHRGIIAEVQGDGVLAIWATAQPDAALRTGACLAALDISDRVRAFNRASRSVQLPTRIGLHAGYLYLGHIGAADHYEYRPTGDIVNTASRIESLNKHLRTQILVSEEVLNQLEGLLTRALGKFLLAGKSKPIAVYELLGRAEACDDGQRKLCATFEKGLRAYNRRQWPAALAAFAESLKIRPDDGPAAFYFALCQKHQARPPGNGWNGWVHLNGK